jgi:hypothetical protein
MIMLLRRPSLFSDVESHKGSVAGLSFRPSEETKMPTRTFNVTPNALINQGFQYRCFSLISRSCAYLTMISSPHLNNSEYDYAWGVLPPIAIQRARDQKVGVHPDIVEGFNKHIPSQRIHTIEIECPGVASRLPRTSPAGWE